ncbi:MAG: glycolate oxidase binding subunit [Alphaproteobacteria bacterium]|jgi:glycolate oxidase FAD binding subunit|nr:glycolate oxidase binding subunit [Alphaproteobacteria bacterium]
MTDTLRPRSAKDVEDAVRWALAEGKTLEVAGHGSKRGIGRPAQTDARLDLSGLTGVTLYEPEELVLSARAGTPLAEIEALVASKGQQLAFEPMDCAPLFGGIAGRGTIGGVLASNLSGPRRLKAGAARDHFLGFSAVSGRGEAFKSGGRVVKNVTGYDLCKLMAGSWGTLAVMTEVTIKVLPRPETQATVLVLGLDDAAAVRAMAAAMASACDVSGAAHLPAAVAARIPLGEAVASGRSVTALRLEGVAPSVAHRRDALIAAMKPLGEIRTSDAMVSRTLWRAIRDVAPFAAKRTGAEQPLWRIATAPAAGAELVARIGEVEVFYDWAGGLIWALLPRPDDIGTALVRRAVAAHATLVRAPAALRATRSVFEPLDGALSALTKRVKAAFDPQGVLNPGRMWAGV